jgi:predicted phosphodiesterase
MESLGADVRVAALYDIHANLPALEAVLREVDEAEPDRIVIGGDAATGPMNPETLDALMALGDRSLFVGGNSDRWTVNVYDDPASVPTDEEHPGKRAAAWAAAQLGRSHRGFLASFVPTVELEVDGLGRTLFCHGSPRSDEEAITAVTPEDRLHRLSRRRRGAHRRVWPPEMWIRRHDEYEQARARCSRRPLRTASTSRNERALRLAPGRLPLRTTSDHPRAGGDETTALLANGQPRCAPQMSAV